MEYNSTVTSKNGSVCILRNGTASDGQALLDVFNLTHEQTDYLLTYPEEHSCTAQQEADYLQTKTDSADEIELLAELEGKIVGSAGISCVGRKEKIRHRAEFGISVDQAYWGLGIRRAVTEACIECAKNAGYTQLELEVVAENRAALALYESVGFEEYGRNPKTSTICFISSMSMLLSSSGSVSGSRISPKPSFFTDIFITPRFIRSR